jgi:hypothetical protein
MLEQAIVDAQALREAALKNAEQALIEKFTPQIKEAVESLLEENDVPQKKKVAYEGKIYSLVEIEDGKATIMREGEKPFVVSEADLGDADLLQEDEGEATGGAAGSPASSVEAPFAGSPGINPDQAAQFTVNVDLDLQEGLEENEDDLVNEIMKILGESDDLLEEELVVDMDEVKDGTFRSDKETLEYYEEMRKAKESAEEKEEENKDLKKENEKLQETIKKFKHKNKQYKDVVEKLSQKLNETLLSNAKLVYSNKTLGDASLNERQKSKIVEAIAKAKTPEEAKNLHEALNATVTSGQENKSPRTLSESVQRKSTLSGILPRRKQVNESEEHTFAEHMKKLAGIK